MAEIDDLYAALEKADKAGNAGDAREIAGHIRALESQPAPTARPAAPTPTPAAAQEPPSRMLEAGLVGATDAATFGAAGPVAAFLASTASKFSDNPVTYAQARQRQADYMRQLEEENWWSYNAGKAAGSVAGGLGIAKGAMAGAKALAGAGGAAGAVGEGAVNALNYAAPVAGAGVKANTARMAAAGAGSGLGTNLAEQGVKGIEAATTDVDERPDSALWDATKATAGGAVAGPLVGGAIAGIGKAAVKARDVVTGDKLGGGWRFIARKLGVDPDTAKIAMDDVERLTGQKASIAQIMDMKQQGVLADIAASKPSAGVAFRNAADEATEALPQQTRDLLRGPLGTPRNAGEMEMATRAPADRFMADVRQRGDSISLTPQEAKGLGSRDFIAATRDLPPELRSRVAGALQGQNELSTHELDIVRQHVGAWADSTPGARNAAAPIRDRLMALAERSSPGYGAQTVRATEAGKLRETGYTAGQGLESNTGVSGATMRAGPELEGYGEGAARRVWDTAGQGPQSAGRALDELSSSPNMQDALSSAYGRAPAGVVIEGARALRSGQQALENIAPPRIRTPDDTGAVADVASAGIAMAHGSPASKMFRAVKALGNISIPDEAAGKIAGMLTSSNPAQVKAAMGALRRAGADDAAVNALMAAAARTGGMRAGRDDTPLVVNVRKRPGQ